MKVTYAQLGLSPKGHVPGRNMKGSTAYGKVSLPQLSNVEQKPNRQVHTGPDLECPICYCPITEGQEIVYERRHLVC